MSDHDEPRYVNRSVPPCPDHERDHVIYTCSDGKTHHRLLAYRCELGLKWRRPEVIDELPPGCDPRLWYAVSVERDTVPEVKKRIREAFPDAIFGSAGNPSMFWVKTSVHPSQIQELDDVLDVVVARYQEDEVHLA